MTMPHQATVAMVADLHRPKINMKAASTTAPQTDIAFCIRRLLIFSPPYSNSCFSSLPTTKEPRTFRVGGMERNKPMRSAGTEHTEVYQIGPIWFIVYVIVLSTMCCNAIRYEAERQCQRQC